ncbi:hypothetical protein RvY_01769 [Ramazzottius varieornatus]|uniref:phospholipase A2 n=1 Tax=Ramazzottius varieornatus TaxID=947166 RepID=A0A1D1UKX3_RAMVA|nr:hypothetical protein RvY_01769 [Ramazzottius varieornatus]
MSSQPGASTNTDSNTDKKLAENELSTVSSNAPPVAASASATPTREPKEPKDSKRTSRLLAQTENQLFTVTNRVAAHKLISDGMDMNASNVLGETPLHAQVMRNNFEVVVALLSRGASPEPKDNKDNTPLHFAVFYNAKTIIVKCLVVFGAKTTDPNKNGYSALSLVQKSMPSKRKDELLAVLSLGAGTTVHAKPNNSAISHVRLQLRKDSLAQGKLDDDETGVNADPPPIPPRKRKRKENVLCLDGGGIRGMILIQLLMSIEEQLDRPIVEYFDWISGTSTGGILALCLAKGVNTLMFQCDCFADTVFFGKRPYKSEPLEDLLKSLFGEDTPMSAIERPRLLIPACMADQIPLNLHFFRNYPHPQGSRKSVANIAPQHQNSHKKEVEDCHTQLMWKAGRATGAAPTYFRSYGGYLDGGLIANNPTLDALTEIFDYFNYLKMEGLPEQIPELGTVISLGTGISPPEAIVHFDIFRPETFAELKKAPRILTGFSTLGRMIVTQATDTDGRVVDRSKTWCHSMGIPFFRFSPLLSRYVPLDCTDDETLIESLWETRLYAANQMSKMRRLSDILRRTRE